MKYLKRFEYYNFYTPPSYDTYLSELSLHDMVKFIIHYFYKTDLIIDVDYYKINIMDGDDIFYTFHIKDNHIDFKHMTTIRDLEYDINLDEYIVKKYNNIVKNISIMEELKGFKKETIDKNYGRVETRFKTDNYYINIENYYRTIRLTFRTKKANISLLQGEFYYSENTALKHYGGVDIIEFVKKSIEQINNDMVLKNGLYKFKDKDIEKKYKDRNKREKIITVKDYVLDNNKIKYMADEILKKLGKKEYSDQRRKYNRGNYELSGGLGVTKDKETFINKYDSEKEKEYKEEKEKRKEQEEKEKHKDIRKDKKYKKEIPSDMYFGDESGEYKTRIQRFEKFKSHPK